MLLGQQSGCTKYPVSCVYGTVELGFSNKKKRVWSAFHIGEKKYCTRTIAKSRVNTAPTFPNKAWAYEAIC